MRITQTSEFKNELFKYLKFHHFKERVGCQVQLCKSFSNPSDNNLHCTVYFERKLFEKTETGVN